MAQPFSTGPVLVYVGVGGVGSGEQSPLFLGTAEKCPKWKIRPAHSPVFNDLSGSMIPYDLMYEGEEAFVAVLLTRWNEAVYSRLAARPTRSSTAVRGFNSTTDIGSLLITEGFSFPLWLKFPYSNLPAYATQPAGYRFLASTLVGPDDFDEQGTNPRKLGLMFHCLRLPVVSNANPLIPGLQLTLYDHNMDGLPAID